MRMIPSQPLQTTSNAEKYVFDQLRMAFTQANQTSWFAMHSLNLPRHAYKRFGEIDFLVCGPSGIFVLEVKGGGVSCHDGLWETTNRYGETKKLRESPFKQAESALHGLRKRLPHSLEDIFVIGYGVILPDVDRLPESAEWERAMLANSRDCKQFEKWLNQFVVYWRDKSFHKTTATPLQLKELQQHLRPDFEVVIPLHVSADNIEKQIIRLTEDQMKFIDIAEVNPRILCSGGAGTGKTMLALELAKRWGALGMKTALVCHSPWLKHFLERSAVQGLTVSLVDALSITARRTGIEQFDALIVDEGQDILHMEALDMLDAHLEGGIHDGRWCFFHDINNQSGLCGRYVPDAYAYLGSLSPVRIPLKTNCRNSLPILHQIQKELDADLGNAGVGNGPLVRQAYVTASDAPSIVEKEIQYLVSEGFNLDDIAILSPLPFKESCVFLMSPKLHATIVVLDEASPRNTNHNNIGFAQIEDFKGLESKVVILVDMPELKGTHLRSLHYVGMSRARVLLSIIYIATTS